MEFASPAWSPWLQEDKEKLERVQMKAIGMISGLTSRSYEEKCKEIGLETLEARRERQDLLEAYKIIQLDGEKMLTRATERAGVVSRTALDPWKLEIPRDLKLGKILSPPECLKNGTDYLQISKPQRTY